MGKTIPLAYTLLLTGLGMIMGCSPISEPVGSEKVQRTQPLEANTASIPSLASVEGSSPPLQPEINDYINHLANIGFNPQSQGIWIQSGNQLLGNYRGTQPLPSASIAKVATTLVALHRFGPDHRFKTRIGTTGTLKNGILAGNLIIEGGEDPFFVWEEAVRIGNLLHQLGIKRITGNLVIVDKFYMNFQQSPLASGNLLKQGLNANIWPPEAEQQYQTLSPDTPRPQLIIDGDVITTTTTPNTVTFHLEQSSFPVAELLKKMNRYSNTQMSRMFNEALGGTQTVAQISAKLSGVTQAEIQLGSGDRISPRAAVAMFLAIGKSLEPHQMTVGDVFAIVGQDEGLLQKRQLPAFSVLKSGIWTNIGALSGAIPTENQKIIWFAMMNFGEETEKSQQEQEIFLEQLLNNLGTVSSLPKELSPASTRKTKTSYVRKL
ncbi:MAG: D-alanyl-D-alanine carboxypeptidase [Crocosphaera sp.]|nr:D-alanyl-D-alanine carboxypeptidase [Crocosphaera sp.]